MQILKVKNSIKLIIAGSLLFSLFYINDNHRMHAENTDNDVTPVYAPDIPKVTWEQYSTMMMEGRGHKAVTNNGKLLSDTASANKVGRANADTVAQSYAKSAPFTSTEQSALTSALPMKDTDLKPVYNNATLNGLLNPRIPTISSYWWTGEPTQLHSLSTTLPERNVPFGNVVSPSNDTSANYINGGKYTCVPPNGTGYVVGGCAISTFPGEAPTRDFNYDGGWSMDTVWYPNFSGGEYMYKSETGAPVTKTSYYPNGSTSEIRIDYNTTWNSVLKMYEVSSAEIGGYPRGTQLLADYVEFDYVTKEPKITTYTGSETLPTSFVVDYDTFVPIHSGVIPANKKLVLLKLKEIPDPQQPSQNKVVVTAEYVIFDTPLVITGMDPTSKGLYYPSTYNIQRRHYYDAKTADNTAVLPPVSTPDVAVRPLISLNPDNILFFKNFDSGKDTVISQILQTPLQFAAKAGNSYKPTIKDPSKAITDMTYDTTDTDILKIDYPNHKVYIKPTTKRLWLTLKGIYGNNGGTSYISGIGKNFASRQTVMARLGVVNPTGTNAVWLKVDSLINPAVIGNIATVNLYAEELQAENYSDYISETPYTFNAIVASKQTVGLDDATKALNGTSMSYGDADIDISAHIMKAPDVDDAGNVYPSSWDKTTPIKVSIDSTDPADSESAEIVAGSETWNGDTGVASAKVHLKDGVGGSDHKIKINIDKALNGGYLDAPRQQIVINVAKRGITITPIEKTMAVGDPYPPTDWQYSNVKTSDEREFGFVNGDTLPYQFSTMDIGKSKGTTSPTVDGNGHISETSMDQQWGINFKPISALDVEKFMKKYDVILKDYNGGNHNSVLDVKRAFDPIKVSDIVTQPTDVELQTGESKAVFSTIYTYPIKDMNNQVIDATYQNLSYQWYKKDVNGNIQAFTPTSVKMEILPNISDKQGEAKFSFTIDPVQNDDNLTSYYIEVWNGMSTMTPVRSNTAQLTTIQEASTYVQYPSKIEVKNDEATASVKGKSSVVLRTLAVDDKAAPKGAFNIQTDPQVQLFLNGDTTLTDFKKIYTMGVLKADGTQVGNDKVLMNLTYPASLTSDFSLEARDKDKKDWGMYKGTMTFTLTYVPKGGTSP